LLFAGGSVLWERWLAGARVQWVKPVYVASIVLMAAALAPTMVPLLPVKTYIRYSAATHLAPPRIETHRLGPLPQLFADQFGWDEMVATVARVYYLWGPREYIGESVIVMDGRQEDLEKRFQVVRKVARVEHPYSMPHNHFDVFDCRGLNLPLKDLWPQVNSWN
jgi:hypothetical protein